MNKKFLLASSIALFSVALLACGNDDTNKEEAGGGDSGDKTSLHIAALESAYGSEMWDNIVASYEKTNPDVDVELTVDKNLEEVISPNMKAGKYPDVVLLGTGRKLALPETMIKDNALEDLTEVLDMDVYGEDVKVNEKLIPGFTDTLVTNPYNDGKTYLAPMFYSPTGLFYNQNLLEEKGWDVPETWDEMWELGDKAKAEGISLFTYPHAGYFDAFFYSLLFEVGGPDFYNRAMSYEDGIWETPEATQAFEIVGKLAEYIEPSTVANGNDRDFTKNQQLVLDDKALFMPNGTWVVGEMEEAPRSEGFEWGMTALPAVEEGGDRYAFTFFEQLWVPEAAENKDAAKDFVTYVYSDEAAKIFAEAGAVQPIEGISSELSGDNELFYSIYDTGAKAGMGGFAATDAVEGVSMADELFATVDSIVTGDKTVEEWQASVEKASDQLRPALK